MAEQSFGWQTNGVGDGPSGGYGLTRWLDFIRKLIGAIWTYVQYVIQNDSGELAVSGTASPIAVAAGSATVYGLFYENTSSLNLTISTPASTTGFRVVLEANWSTQTVRAKVVMNTVGNSGAPTITQNPGTLFQIPLARGTITNTGVISLTDERVFRSNLFVSARQGGSATNWNSIGTTNYVPTRSKIQMGVYQFGGNAAGETVTFPEPFSAAPVVFVSFASGVYSNFTPAGYNETTTQFTAMVRNASGQAAASQINWIAIGPV